MLVYVKYECFVMQMLYVWVLCSSCGSPQCCVLHDLQFVNAGQVFKSDHTGAAEYGSRGQSPPHTHTHFCREYTK